jgi:signal peptidase I
MKKIVTIIVVVLTSLFVTLAITILVLGISSAKSKTPIKLFGISYSVVGSGSMEPLIKIGDFILYREIDYDNVKEGDIIVYYSDIFDRMIVHRVILIDNIDGEANIYTKGDANPSADLDIISRSNNNLYGIVIAHFGFLGIGNLVLNFKNIIFVVIGLIFIVMLTKEGFSIYFQIAQMNKKKEMEAKILKEKEILRNEILRELEEKKDEKL